ncbi:MAG: FAD-dependent oxidoreductase [Phycisphaerae bacterium]|nr:FAD-dependent oxidoreductase [Phycisphaerae bacterium]
MTGTNDQQPSNAIRQAWRSLPVTQTVDVLVVGGGPAGCAAAIAAARDDAATLLIERFGCLGGMGTSGLVPAFCPYTDKQRTITRGIALTVLNAMKDEMPHLDADALDWVPIDPERLKFVYDELVTGSGARVLFFTDFITALTQQDGAVESVIAHNKSGLRRIKADVIIDCTGDADVAADVGVPFAKGDPDSGELQPCTMCFVLAGIDNKRLQQFLWADAGRNLLLKEVIAQAKADGRLNISEGGANVAYQSPCTIGLNFSHVFGVDATDAEQLSQAQRDGRRLIRHLTDFMRAYCPGCENALLVNSGVQIGVRETRRILGEYVLTLDDYLARRAFPDEIARNAYYIDIHPSQRQPDMDAHEYAAGESHGVPYGCLIPRGPRNMLVAGRCISTDRPVQGSTRTMPLCLATGEAAGCAARMALEVAGNVRSIDTQALRDRLRHHGQYLP